MLINTKQILANALIEISKTKAIEKITIKNVVDYCHTGRQTFYNHFKDKEELIGWIYKQDADKILSIFNNHKDWNECIYKIYLVFLDNKQFYTKVMKTDGQNSFMSFLFEDTRQYYIQSIAERFGEEELTERLRYTITFNCYGAVNLCRKWILSGMEMPAEEISQIIIENMPCNLKKYFV